MLWAILLGVGFAPGCSASAPDYAKEVRPLLEKRCYSCHSRLKQKGGLRLDGGALIHQGGKHGPAVLPGRSGESPLILRVTAAAEDERMPPEGKALPSEEIALLRAWVGAGASFPPGEKAPSSPADHWAFQPVKRPPLPAVKNEGWVRAPIDRFILAKLEAAGLRPAPPAEPAKLLRRAALDLTGLPPSIAEQEEFARRVESGGWQPALDRTVEDLLARPAHGERWARHWLDLVRYADSNGYERDAAKPFVWRYRDWVIRALNQDKPYDRFLVEQIAGDELPEANASTMIATGMLRLGHWDDEPADPEADRYDQLDDIVSTTSQAVLGLTMGCARCHDHKFEPLSSRDYYAMAAVFTPLKRPQNGRTELTVPVGTREELAAFTERERRLAALKTLPADERAAARKRWVESGQTNLSDPDRVLLQTEPARRSEEQKKRAGELEKKLDAEIAIAAGRVESGDPRCATDPRASLHEALHAHLKKAAEAEREMASLRASVPEPPQGYIWTEPSATAPETRLLIRGNPRRTGEPVLPGEPAIFAKFPMSAPEPDGRTTRRRLAFAHWLASPDNPLTARVIVNRVWQHHFGEGLVRTPSDFGLMGEAPAHPELLDWLADWFVHDAGWSLKKLHRLLLSSNTWRMRRGVAAAEALRIDPENQLLARMPYQRLEAEAIRDSMLAVSGRLNPAMFGPAVFPPIPEAAIEANTDKHSIWTSSSETEASRRSIYVFIKRGLVVPMLEVLDLCDTVNSTARRPVTTIAPQALTLFNGDFAAGQAKHFAARLLREAGPERERQIDLAFRLALCRPPSGGERTAMLGFFARESGAADAGETKAREQLCRVLLNLNEFVYPD